MKKPILAMLAAVACLAAHAEWKIFGETEQSGIFFDPATVHVRGSEVRVWTLRVIGGEPLPLNPMPGAARYRSVKYLVVINCDTRESYFRETLWLAHAAKPEAGEVLTSTLDTAASYRPISPSTPVDALRIALCP